MTAKVDDLLPTAKELLEQIALAEAEKAAESMRKRAEAEAEKKRLLDTFSKPSLSDEEAIRQGIAIIPARGEERADGSPGLPVPQRIVHRSRARHQSDGTRLGEHPDRRS